MEDALKLHGYLMKEKSKFSRLHGLTGDINKRYFRIRNIEVRFRRRQSTFSCNMVHVHPAVVWPETSTEYRSHYYDAWLNALTSYDSVRFYQSGHALIRELKLTYPARHLVYGINFADRSVQGSDELALCYYKNSADREVRGWIYLTDVTEIAERQDTIILTSVARTLHLYAQTRAQHSAWVTGLAKLCPDAFTMLGRKRV